ncbi:MAG: peptidase dimerization domain-containing protein [Gemmatimonadaceae bacterium]
MDRTVLAWGFHHRSVAVSTRPAVPLASDAPAMRQSLSQFPSFHRNRLLRVALIVAFAQAVVEGTTFAQSAPVLNPTAALLVELIRVNTSNPPGNEGQLDDLLAPKFKALGFEVDIFPTPQAGKSHLIARLMHAVMRNTYAPVIMSAGIRTNAIPGSAEATINVRPIPGTTVAEIFAELTKVVNDARIEIRSTSTAAPTSSRPTIRESSTNTGLYQALEREAKVTYPGARVTPYLFQAGTDADAWRSRGIPVYGIYPYAITADELTRMHGNDERVGIAASQEGTDMIFRTLVSVAGKG